MDRMLLISAICIQADKLQDLTARDAPMKDMNGKNVIITGAGTGLGAATAIALARKGANIAVNYSSSAEAAEKVAEVCRSEGVQAFSVKASVAEFADCQKLVAETVENFERIYRVNVIGAYQMVRAARAALEVSGEGAVVNVSSMAGARGVGSSIAYAASKGALNTLTLSLARSLAPKIRVNAVCPGYMASGWFTKWGDKDADEALARNVAQMTPLQRAATPEDVAGLILFLAAPASRNITGELILSDGGMHLGAIPRR